MSVIERFVVLLYDRTSNQVKVNQARQELFPKRYEKGFTLLSQCLFSFKGIMFN